MNSAKLTALIFLLLLIQGADAQHKKKEKDEKQSKYIKILSATSQDWVRGRAPGGGGTTYTVKIKIQTEDSITFKNMWIGYDFAPFDLQTFTHNPNKKFTKGDSILLVSRKDAGDRKPPTENADQSKDRMDYKGAALIEFFVRGKKEYLIVEKFDKKEIFKGD